MPLDRPKPHVQQRCRLQLRQPEVVARQDDLPLTCGQRAHGSRDPSCLVQVDGVLLDSGRIEDDCQFGRRGASPNQVPLAGSAPAHDG